MPTALKKPIEFETTFRSFIAHELIGEGGSGRVFGGVDADGASVAIKLLNSDLASTDKRARFQNELNFLQKATHPNLVRVIDHGKSDLPAYKGPFFVMPRYSGSLADLMDQRIDAAAVMELFGQLLDGVEAAHLMKVTHRDIKPANVLFTTQENSVTLALADFGIARFLPEDQVAHVKTGRADRMANFHYAAPEQGGGGIVSHKADIFSLGLLLNQMFTGDIPRGTGYKQVAAVAPSYAYVDAVVSAMTQQNPAARPENIEAIKRMLRVEHEQAMARQALDEKTRQVVPARNFGSDRYISDPLRIVDADWDDGVLKLVFNRRVDDRLWIEALQNMGSFSSAMGAPPTAFQFSENEARVRAEPHYVESIIAHFKGWLPIAAQVYKARIERRQQEEEAAERQKLDAEIAAIKRRNEVREKLKRLI